MPKTIEQEKTAALLRPIKGQYKDLAREIRKLMGHESPRIEDFMTPREASRITGVNFVTISDALRGERVSYATLMKLAKGLNGDAETLLTAAGYDAREYGRGVLNSLPPASLSLLTETGLDADPDAAQLLGIYHDLSPEHRQMLLAIARAVQAGTRK